MNKKFSTLVAGVLLASSVGASAQTFTPAVFASDPEIRQAKYYALGVDGATDVVSVAEATDGTLVLKKVTASTLNSLAKVDSALWTVSANVTGDGGATRFVMTNKATGITFSFDPKNALKETGTATSAVAGKAAEIGGVLTQWIWYDSRYQTAANDLTNPAELTMDFSKGDSTLVVRVDGTSGVIYAAKDSKQNLKAPQKLQILTPGTWAMNASDLNTKGETVKYMQLSFAGTAGKNNMLADKYQAQDLSSTAADTVAATLFSPFVKFFDPAVAAATGHSTIKNTVDDNTVILNKVGDDGKLAGGYLHVDTSYYASKGATYKLYNKLAVSTNTVTKPGSAFQIDTLGYNLPDDAFRFMFTKNLLTDSISVSAVSGFVETDAYNTPLNKKENSATKYTMIGETSDLAAFGFSDYKGAISAALTDGIVTTTADDVANNVKGNNVLSHCTLEGETTKVVTFYKEDGANLDNQVNLLAYADGPDSDYTSYADGLYLIQDAKNASLFYGVHIYEADSIAKFVTIDASEMNLHHMPAFQWVVLKKDHSATRADISPVQISNREFYEYNDFLSQLRKGSKDGQYRIPSLNAEVKFVPVEDAARKSKVVGYKNFKAEDLLVNQYTFNYLHPYTLAKYISTHAEDSLMDVLGENPTSFTVKAVKSETYGYPAANATAYITDLAQLQRSTYDIVANFNKGVYVNKEHLLVATDKPSADDQATTFLFKENNQIDREDVPTCYYALINIDGVDKAGVTDNDLKALMRAQVMTETRTSVFAIAADNKPLYRRFNNINLGETEQFGGADSLTFVEKIRKEYLMDENNENLMDKVVNYLGMWTEDKATGLGFRIDTAWVERGYGKGIKPQYLVSVDRHDVEATPGVPCPDHGFDPNCPHWTPGTAGFAYGKYLVSFADSVAKYGASKKGALPYLDVANGYTRVGFVKAIQSGDSLFILVNGFENIAPEKLDTATIAKAYRAAEIDGTYIKNLKGDAHKNVTWSFRYVNPENAANVTKEGDDNAFLFESASYDGNTVAYGQAIAPEHAAWLKIQNGCVVLTNSSSTFTNAKTGGDGALVFNANQLGTNEDLATDNETIATSEVTVIAGEGQVTIANAEGKKVVITNILGQVVANTVITSDNAVIAAPQGVVVVAVDGEEAVKAIIK